MSNKVKILDCTLRDGGYVNNWEFSNSAIKSIITTLVNAKIEIIECGFISQKKGKEKDSSLFHSIETINDLLNELDLQNCSTEFCVMINFGEYNVNDLPKYNNEKNKVNGIRLAFHKKDWEKAFQDAQKIVEKGYKIFIQPMVTMTYSDEEIIRMINCFNSINIYSVYIVDSFGSMMGNDFRRIYYLFEHNTKENVEIGYHSHNNLQLAYSNAVDFIKIKNFNRKIIIDSSIQGMGRGAGNLNTELFCNYMNKKLSTKYNIDILLEIIDSYLNAIFHENYWGYSVAHFLSAKFNCHPNYASFLVDKKVLSIVDIRNILDKIDESKLVNYDKNYIESKFIEYQSNIKNLKINDFGYLAKKNILIIASGPNEFKQKNKIEEFIKKNNPFIIIVNHFSEFFKGDVYFFSNSKRYLKFCDLVNKEQVIVTSNINDVSIGSNVKVADYKTLVNISDQINDNSTILLINLLINYDLHEVSIAGFDGYNLDSENYSYNENDRIFNKKLLESKNEEVLKVLKELKSKIEINFITDSVYENK